MVCGLIGSVEIYESTTESYLQLVDSFKIHSLFFREGPMGPLGGLIFVSVSHTKFYAPIQQLITDNPWSGVPPVCLSFPFLPSSFHPFPLTIVLYKTHYY